MCDLSAMQLTRFGWSLLHKCLLMKSATPKTENRLEDTTKALKEFGVKSAVLQYGLVSMAAPAGIKSH